MPLKNAAKPGTCYPMLGMGTRGPGYKIGMPQQCWYYPVCCTKDYCPSITGTKDYLMINRCTKEQPCRIDTGYPFGDIASKQWGEKCGAPPKSDEVEGNLTLKQRRLHWCDPHGIHQGIEQSGVPRENLFISIMVGSAGPMGGVASNWQANQQLVALGIENADLLMQHEGDLGTPGHGADDTCKKPPYDKCRIESWKSCLEEMKSGRTKACGVANWQVEWLQALKDAGLTLPAVVQTKFHPHQSTAYGPISALKKFCDENGILFNGYSPMGRADWTRFESSVGKPTLFQEPALLDIAKRVQKTPGQVLLRWNIQQGVATQARSINPTHIKDNMDVFDWTLSNADMQTLSSMPQCHTPPGNLSHTLTAGCPFMKDDSKEYPGHCNMIGPTVTC